MLTGAQAGLSRPPSEFRAPAIRSLIGGCLGLVLGSSPILILSFGVYMPAIVRDTGWDRATVASAIGFTTIFPGLLSPLIGMIINRCGPRRFVTVGFPLSGLTVMLLSTPRSAAMFAAALALAGVFTAGQTMLPYVYVVSGWFDRRRGLALGILLSFTGVGLALIPPLVAQVIAHFGWRGSYLLFGALVVVVSIPVGRWLIVDPPAVVAVDRDSVPGVPWKLALRRPVLWYLTISIMLVGAAVAGGIVNLPIILTERGVTPQLASFVMSVIGISMILARLMFGYLFDRMRPQLLTTFICVMVGAAFVILASTHSPVAVLVGAMLIGIGFGAEGDAMSYMISRAFGIRDFGAIFGIMFLAFSLGGGFGPVIFAQLYAHSGSYQLPIIVAAVASGVATLLVLLIREADLPYGRRSLGSQTIDAELAPLIVEQL
jgi:OFA family oxalate/formate antiporter-like MFS transporter